ncbi:MAG: tetratricopeptide repeat protein [Rhodospirillales bacterium]
MLKDDQGHALAGATAEALQHYNMAVAAYNQAYGDPMGGLNAAIAVAPAFVMPRLAKAWLLSQSRDPTIVPKAAAELDTATTLAMNEREQGHAAALTKAVEGARYAAVGLLDRHLMRFPFDTLAHQIALLSDLALGRSRWMRDRVGRAMPLWSKDMPGFAPMQTFHAFGLEENAHYAWAEDLARSASETIPNSYFVHHTVSHVMEMTGRPEDGVGWMTAREPLWSTAAHPNRDHIWWHKALYHLDLGQYVAALAIYDGPFLAAEKALAISLTHASALLWRLDTLGVDVADRWVALHKRWNGHADGHCLAFADLHAIMAELRSGQESMAEKRLIAMRETAAGTEEGAPIYREAGVPFAEGLIAFHRGKYLAAIEHFLPVRFALWQVGGSHAQRDVFDWTIAEAAVRSGNRAIAVSLANERTMLKPRSHINRRFARNAEAIAS